MTTRRAIKQIATMLCCASCFHLGGTEFRLYNSGGDTGATPFTWSFRVQYGGGYDTGFINYTQYISAGSYYEIGNYGFSEPGTGSYSVGVNNCNLATGTFPFAHPGSGPVNIYGFIGASNGVYFTHWCYTNTSASYQQISGVPGESATTLAPGETHCTTIAGNANVSVSNLGQPGQVGLPDGTNSIFNGGITNTPPGYPAGQDAQQLAAGAPGNPILWDNTGTDAARDSTLKAGFSALANNQNIANGYLAKLLGISNGVTVNVGGSSNVWVQNWPSNGVASAGTNVFEGGSNVWVQNWPSNNFVGSNVSYDGILGQFTNWAVAKSKADTAFEPLTTAFADVAAVTAPTLSTYDNVGFVVPCVTAGHDFSFNWNFASDIHWTPLFVLMRGIWVFLLTLLFLTKMVQEIWNGTVSVCHTHGIPIPPLNATLLGFGGNVPGALLTVVLVAIVLAALAALITAITGLLVGLCAGFGGLSSCAAILHGDFFAGATAGIAQGIGIVYLCFPVELAVTYAISVLLFRLAKLSIGGPLMVALRIVPST